MQGHDTRVDMTYGLRDRDQLSKSSSDKELHSCTLTITGLTNQIGALPAHCRRTLEQIFNICCFDIPGE